LITIKENKINYHPFNKISHQITKNHLQSHSNNYNHNPPNKKLNASNYNKIFSIIIKMLKLPSRSNLFNYSKCLRTSIR